MSDLISREAVLEWLRKSHNEVVEFSCPSKYNILPDLKDLVITEINEFMGFVAGLEPAYDVNKVIQSMKEYTSYLDDDNDADVVAKDLIAIVQEGAGNEKPINQYTTIAVPHQNVTERADRQ